MQSLIKSIGQRLGSSAYYNEAAITHGVVMPILAKLGWDTADPLQVHPEFANARGRVDFALIGLGQKPSVFIEVKAVGRSLDGDRQLFEYAFHEGVPLCVLTDGREWNFYVPSGQGSYDDRRVYRLQLDDRDPAECEAILIRYLQRSRILDQSALDDALADYRNAAGLRQAIATLPAAWHELLAEEHELIIETLVDKAEALCGYKPRAEHAVKFLRQVSRGAAGQSTFTVGASSRGSKPASAPPQRSIPMSSSEQSERGIRYRVLEVNGAAPTAASALTEILRAIVAIDPTRIQQLSDAVRTRNRSLIDRSPELINPARPDLARAVEISPGWLVGLTISNSDKLRIIMAACALYGLNFPQDVAVVLPNT
jgi:hypothetical protein